MKMNWEIKIKNIDRWLSMLFVCWFSISMFLSALDWILQGRFGIPSLSTDVLFTIEKIIITAIVCIMLILGYRRITIDCLILFILLLVLYVISMTNDQTFYQVVRQNLLIKTFVLAFPGFLFIRIIRDKSYVYTYLNRISYPMLIMLVCSFLVYNVGEAGTYLTYSNGVMSCALLFVYNAIVKKSKLSILLSFICVILIFMAGRRLSLFFLLFAVTLLCIMNRKFKPIIVLAILSLIVIFFYEDLLIGIINIANNLDLNTRTLNKLLAGEMLDDSYRFEQYFYGLQLAGSTIKNSLLGLGIAGERNYFLNNFSHMVLQGYPHNIVIEMVLHYGFLFGIIIICILGYYIISYLLNTKYMHIYSNENFVFYYFTICFGQLMLSDSYIQSPSFFVFLGIIVNYALKKQSICQLRKFGKQSRPYKEIHNNIEYERSR